MLHLFNELSYVPRDVCPISLEMPATLFVPFFSMLCHSCRNYYGNSSFCAWPRLKLILVLVCPFHLKSRDTTNGMGLLTVSDWGFCWLCTKIHWTVCLGALAQSNQSPHHLPTEQITLLLARPPGQLRPCYWPVFCLCTYIIKLYMYLFCYLFEYLVMSLSKHLIVSLSSSIFRL